MRRAPLDAIDRLLLLLGLVACGSLALAAIGWREASSAPDGASGRVHAIWADGVTRYADALGWAAHWAPWVLFVFLVLAVALRALWPDAGPLGDD